MIAGIVLAAGRGKRFGADKLLHAYRGRPLIAHALRPAIESALDAIVVITDPARPELDETVRELIEDSDRVRIIHNDDPARGQMSSVKTGLRALPAETGAAMIILGDMPGLSDAVYDTLITEFRRNDCIVIPSCGDQPRHPRVIPQRLFGKFLELDDGERGTAVIERYRHEVLTIGFDESRWFADVDTRADLAMLDSDTHPR